MIWFVLSILFFCASTIGTLLFAKKIEKGQKGMTVILMLGIIALLSIAIFSVGYFVPAEYEVVETSYELMEFGTNPDFERFSDFHGKYVGINEDNRYFCYFDDMFHVCNSNATIVVAEKGEIAIKSRKPVLGLWSYQGYWGIPEIIEETVYVPYGTLLE